MKREEGRGKREAKIAVGVLFLNLSSFFFLPSSISAVDNANVSVTARAPKEKVRIGDEVRVLLQVEHPRKYSVQPLDPKMQLSPFEVKRIEPAPVVKGQNRVQETFRMTLIAFATGDLNVPPIRVRYTDEGGKPGEASSDPIPVKVTSVGKKLTDKDDIRAIKGPVSIGTTGFWTGLASFFAALLFIILTVKIVLRKIKELKDSESRKPLPVRVKIELARLKDQGYLEEKNYKDFYSGLSDVLRRYLERRFGIEALEKTSAEVREELQKRSFEKERIADVEGVLTEADLVKFAKFAPPYELAGKLESAILQFVEETKPQPNPERRAKRGAEG